MYNMFFVLPDYLYKLAFDTTYLPSFQLPYVLCLFISSLNIPSPLAQNLQTITNITNIAFEKETEGYHIPTSPSTSLLRPRTRISPCLHPPKRILMRARKHRRPHLHIPLPVPSLTRSLFLPVRMLDLALLHEHLHTCLLFQHSAGSTCSISLLLQRLAPLSEHGRLFACVTLSATPGLVGVVYQILVIC